MKPSWYPIINNSSFSSDSWARFQFQSNKRIDLQSLVEHRFFSLNFIKNRNQLNLFEIKTSSIRIDDLIHLCTKLNLKHSRWILTLKERCLFELILHIKNFNQFNPTKYGLSQFVLLFYTLFFYSRKIGGKALLKQKR